MPESIRGLGRILADEIGRRVAIVASGDGLMTRFLPGVELFVHHMTVGAGGRVIAHVRVTLGINKREKADADEKADGNAYESKFDRLDGHSILVFPNCG